MHVIVMYVTVSVTSKYLNVNCLKFIDIAVQLPLAMLHFKNVPVIMLRKIALFQKMLEIHIHNTTENVQSAHLQLQREPSVAFKIPSQPS